MARPPIHAARLAEKLGINRVMVPSGAGVGSAVGFLMAPVAYEVVRSRYVQLDADKFDPAFVNKLFAEMRAEAEAVVKAGAPHAKLIETRTADMRYRGQGHEITVSLPPGEFSAASREKLIKLYEEGYAATFGRTIPGLSVEIMNWTLRLAAEQAALPKAPPQPADKPAKARGSRQVYDPTDQDMKDVAVYHRADLVIGSFVPGPAVIAEDETTTIVPKSFARAAQPDRRPSVGKGGNMSINDPLSPIRLQLMWDRLIAVVEEQALALMRTGFSTSTREAGDLSAGVFDLSGAMLAQAVTGTPGHINSMARAVYHFLDRFPAPTMKEGDIFLTNDPWKGTGHLHDFTFVTPTFRRGKMVALFASTCHVVDIGGRGMTADARNNYEEGLYIPLMRFAHAGTVDQTLVDIVGANVREPIQVVGDLYSLATCNEIGCRRLIEMMDEFAIDDLDRLGAHVLAKSKHASLEAIAKIKPGEYKFSMTVDGYDKPIDLVATMKIGPHRHRCRFRRHLGRLGLRHQRAGLLHRGLFLVRREVHRGAQGAEQRGLAVGDPRHRARGLDPERQEARAGRRAPRHGPDAARRDVRLPAPGYGRRRSSRGYLVPVEPDGAGRPRQHRRRSRRNGERAGRSPS